MYLTQAIEVKPSDPVAELLNLGHNIQGAAARQCVEAMMEASAAILSLLDEVERLRERAEKLDGRLRDALDMRTAFERAKAIRAIGNE